MTRIFGGGAEITWEMTRFFFDTTLVETALDRKERRVLGGTGAFARRVMRSRIRKAPKQRRNKTFVRVEGTFPRYHAHPNTGIRLILFAYVPFEGALYVGPVKFNSASNRFYQLTNRKQQVVPTGGKTVPQLVNDGGQTIVTRVYKSGRVYRLTRTHRSFPYRDLTFEIVLPKFRELMETIPL